MGNKNPLFVFRLDEQLFALHLDNVERVLRAAEISPLPDGPEVIPGLINVAGRIIPVVDLRKRFQFPEREIDPSDHFIIARTPRRTVALWIDEARGLLDHSGEEIAGARILPGLKYILGVVKLEGNVVLIHDLDRCLSLEEEEKLAEALAKIGEQ